MRNARRKRQADLASLAEALADSASWAATSRLDQWERVHLARGLAALFLGCYGGGDIETALALTIGHCLAEACGDYSHPSGPGAEAETED